MQQVSSGDAQLPLLHHVAIEWYGAFGHGQHVGEQSLGELQAAPLAAIPKTTPPVPQPHAGPSFPYKLSTEWGAVAVAGPPLQLDAGGDSLVVEQP